MVVAVLVRENNPSPTGVRKKEGGVENFNDIDGDENGDLDE